MTGRTCATTILLLIISLVSISQKANAQLVKVWEHDLSSSGTFTGDFSDYDNDGNIFIAYNNNGIGVIKIDTAGTILYDVVYQTSEEVYSIWADNTGGAYVVANEWNSEGRLSYVRVLKFDAYGTMVWSDIITPGNDYYSGSSYGYYCNRSVTDVNGNLWFAFSNPDDNPCPAGGSVLFTAQLYRYTPSGDKITVLDYRPNIPVGSGLIQDMETDNEGNIHVFLSVWEYCCNAECSGCYTTCFTVNGAPSDYQRTSYVRSYNSSGGMISETSYDLTGPSCDSYDLYCKDLTLFGGKRNGLVTVVTEEYQVDVGACEYQSVVSCNGWNTTVYATVDAALTDDVGDLYVGWRKCEWTKAAHLAEMGLTKFDGSSGAELWTIAATAPNYISDGYMYRTIANYYSKADLDGNVVWVASTTGSLLWNDSDGNHYFGGQTVTRYHEGMDILVNDVNGDPMADTEFELVKITPETDTFVEDTLGWFTTDYDGKFRTEVLGADSVRIETSGGTDTLLVGDLIKVSRHVHSQASAKHQSVLPTMYTIHLDNASVAADGSINFDTVGGHVMEVTIDHTEIRYNLLVSVEWDTDMLYTTGLQDNIKAMANFLYDVTDGQVRLDTVVILDDRREWFESDIQVRASNVIGSYTHWQGIYSESVAENGFIDPTSIVVPRRDYGNALDNRDSSYVYHPLSGISLEAYRVMAHEFGHYALGFYDEYLFCCAADGSYDNNVSSPLKCPEVDYYGYMHWLRSEAGERVSESSSAYTYSASNCRNTKQYYELGMSCWDYLETSMEGRYALDDAPSVNAMVPIITPDDPEREHPEGLDYLPGPNNNLGTVPGELDYNVGELIVFPEPVVPQEPMVRNLHVAVFGTPVGGVQVKLNKAVPGGMLAIDQGMTTDFGLIWVMGAREGVDQIDAGVNHFEINAPPGIGFASSTVNEGWLFSSALVSASDSIEIHLAPIDGYYPVICEPTLGLDNLELKLRYQNAFDETPALEVRPSHGISTSPALTIGAGTYDVTITDSLGGEGSFEVDAVDASAQNFRFWFDYLEAPLDSSDMRVFSQDRLSLVTFDSIDTEIERSLLVTSSYPVIRSGLDPDAVQAGQTQSLSVYPSTAMTHNGVITIGYDDGRLLMSDALIADESNLQIYHWDESLSEWVLIGGFVDTLQNEVWSAIPGPGVYAAFTTDILTDIGDEHGDILPYSFELSQNYPNPFNPVTTIEYSLSRRAHVTIEVYNVLGQRVQTLVDRGESAGSYSVSWDGKTENGQSVATGVYLYRFQAGDYIETRKMLLLK